MLTNFFFERTCLQIAMENLGVVQSFSVCSGHRNKSFCNVPDACPAPACHGGSIQPNNAQEGLQREDRSKRTNLPGSNRDFQAGLNQHRLVARNARELAAGEAAPDDSTRGRGGRGARLLRWSTNRVHPDRHPDRRLRIERLSADRFLGSHSARIE